jgi:group I intron endonuclease
MKLTDKFEKCPGIYIFTNLINGKVYVGETLNIERRIPEHLSKTNQIIHRAIRKYGVENFKVEVYYLPDFKEKDLVELQDQLIIKFNCLLPKGYNACYGQGGSSGRIFTEETRSKMSNSAKSKPPVSEETKRKISIANKGRTHSVQSKLKMSASQKIRKNLSRKGQKSYVRTAEIRLKMSLAGKGREASDASKEKMSLAKKNREKLSCPHCNKTMDKANAMKYHFKKCKDKGE